MNQCKSMLHSVVLMLLKGKMLFLAAKSISRLMSTFILIACIAKG